MPDEYVCLSTLRGISVQAAAIIDRYASERAIWVPVAAFRQFMHTLHWGDFAELDLSLLDGLEAGDRVRGAVTDRACGCRIEDRA